jgi:hypothetical protein
MINPMHGLLGRLGTATSIWYISYSRNKNVAYNITLYKNKCHVDRHIILYILMINVV